MTTEDLRTLLREDVLADEPAFTMSSATPIARGRRKLRSRRLTTGVATLAVVGLAAVTAPSLLGGNDDGPELSPASVAALERYDAKAMPALVDRVVRDTVDIELPDGQVVARDSQDVRLPEEHQDKASSWHADYAWDSQHLFNVTLMHARSETEGSARRFCEGQVSSGYDLSCDVERLEDGTVVITSTSALRKGGQEPRDVRQTWYSVADLSRVDPGRLWFRRDVTARRGGDFLVAAYETVKAPTLADARAQWRVDLEDLDAVALQPELVFPNPPIDEQSGCVWFLPQDGTDLRCNVSGDD